jgi:hypothetical protein
MGFISGLKELIQGMLATFLSKRFFLTDIKKNKFAFCCT